MMKNANFCLIGRDSHDNEQRELSPGANRFFSEQLNTLNYTNFLLKVRENFLCTERGEDYFAHKVSPKSFFCCPLTVSDGKPDAATVWGECGFYGGGREFRYAQFYMEDYQKLPPREYIDRVFTSEFSDGEALTALFDRDRKAHPEPEINASYRENFEPEINESDRALVCEVCEKLCGGKTVVLKLKKCADFNDAAKKLLVQIMSLLPGNFRRQIGFATYLQPKQISAFRSQTNNLRLMVVDSDVDTTGLEDKNFSIIAQNREHKCSELYEYWSKLSYSERENQAERFSAMRIPGSKLLCELARMHRGKIEPTTPETISPAEPTAQTVQTEPAKAPEKQGISWFLEQKEVKLIAGIAAIIALMIGLALGKLIW